MWIENPWNCRLDYNKIYNSIFKWGPFALQVAGTKRKRQIKRNSHWDHQNESWTENPQRTGRFYMGKQPAKENIQQLVAYYAQHQNSAHAELSLFNSKSTFSGRNGGGGGGVIRHRWRLQYYRPTTRWKKCIAVGYLTAAVAMVMTHGYQNFSSSLTTAASTFQGKKHTWLFY